MSKKQNGGVSIKADKVSIGGDVVGGNKVVTQYGMLDDEFKKIKALIEKRPDDAAVDKVELKDLLARIEAEVKKGEQANPSKLERWLKFLAGMSDDIFQVTAAVLTNPVAGVAKTIQLIVKRAK
jgi:hypothetical protein